MTTGVMNGELGDSLDRVVSGHRIPLVFVRPFREVVWFQRTDLHLSTNVLDEAAQIVLAKGIRAPSYLPESSRDRPVRSDKGQSSRQGEKKQVGATRRLLNFLGVEFVLCLAP